MNAYSIDLRERVIKYIEEGGSRRSACEIFSVGERTIGRWVSLKKETKSLSPRPHGGGYPAKIDLTSIEEYVNTHSDKTLKDLGKEFSVSHVAIWKVLRKIGYVYKKNSTV